MLEKIRGGMSYRKSYALEKDGIVIGLMEKFYIPKVGGKKFLNVFNKQYIF